MMHLAMRVELRAAKFYIVRFPVLVRAADRTHARAIEPDQPLAADFAKTMIAHKTASTLTRRFTARGFKPAIFARFHMPDRLNAWRECSAAGQTLRGNNAVFGWIILESGGPLSIAQTVVSHRWILLVLFIAVPAP
jgi:hypothetical protein